MPRPASPRARKAGRLVTVGAAVAGCLLLTAPMAACGWRKGEAIYVLPDDGSVRIDISAP